MRCTSSGVAGRWKSSPMASRRMVPCPTIIMTLGPVPWRSKMVRCSEMGHCERPSWFTTTVVTPWLTMLGALFRRMSSFRMV